MTGENLWSPGGDGWCRVTLTGFADDLRKKHVHFKTPTTKQAADRIMEYDRILSEEIAKEGYVQNVQTSDDTTFQGQRGKCQNKAFFSKER